jgi:hypothetical protein
MRGEGFWAKTGNELLDDPLLVLALLATLVAMATTPIAFAVLARMEWFKARRGRVVQRPEFSSIVVGMMLVMVIPSIFAALVLKSRYFDRNRYEFDPNRTWSVLEQGRGLKSLEEADAAVKREMERLALERKNLLENVKKLDEAMLALRSVAGTSPSVDQALPRVLQSLAAVRKCVGLDGPQQLQDLTASPIELKVAAADIHSAITSPVPGTPAPFPAPATMNRPIAADASGQGLSRAQVQAEISAVPEAQRDIASMLPLSNLPPGWSVGKSGTKHIETFNADNLYEKIDGRAESFLQYGVKGMAYSFYHPTGDPSNELQIYVFEMTDGLKAMGKYGSEKPDDAKIIQLGSEGYTSAGSTLFYAGKYYTQIVSTQDDSKFAAVAIELAGRVASLQKQRGGSSLTSAAKEPELPRPVDLATANPQVESSAKLQPGSEVTPDTYFALLPAQGKQGDNKYVAQDVFGYSFFSDVFMADYKEGEVTWQGFLRPYRDAKQAKEVLEKYIASVKQDGAEVKPLQSEGADEMIVSSSIGLFDIIFRKGNTLAGANGATKRKPAEVFARSLARSLPAEVRTIRPQL